MIYKLHSGMHTHALRRTLGRTWWIWCFIWFTALVALLVMLFDYPLVISGHSKVIVKDAVTPGMFISNAKLLNEVNQVRTSHGLSALTENAQLDSSALAKANDMCTGNYFEHGNWLQFVKNSGYSYENAGENLAYSTWNTTAENIVQGWVASPGHYENMMNPAWTEEGMAFVVCPNYQGQMNDVLVVNHFGQPKAAPVATSVAPKVKSACH